MILCTGFTERMPEHKALQLGFRAFVMKPVVTREIAHKVRQALDSKGEGQRPISGKDGKRALSVAMRKF